MREIVSYAFFRFLLKLKLIFYSLAGDFLCFWWGVSKGERCQFKGLPVFMKHYKGNIKIGDKCILTSSPKFNYAGINRRTSLSVFSGASITIGDDCGMSGAVLAASKSITLGNRVLLGVNCTLLDSDHHALNAEKRFAGDAGGKAEIVIEDDVWLGMNVTVLKGVTIGKGTVVAANSTVVRSLPSGVLAGGSPAKVIKEIK